MTAVIDAGMDLEWVTVDETFMEDCCQRVVPSCDNVAVRRVTFAPEMDAPEALRCACGRHKKLLCLPCFEHLSSGEGWVMCSGCHLKTGGDFFKRIVASEPIR